MTSEQKRLAMLVSALLVIGGLLYFLSDAQTGVSKKAEITNLGDVSIIKDAMYYRAKEITDPQGFINTGGDPIKISDYIGKKVVLVDFWTYSCINCIRTQPYLNAWYDKYKDDGFVIVGVHTPEFEFEKIYDNVLQATKDEGIKYPVVLDNNYGTWRAYQNSYWPRKYLIDIDGYIVYDHIGEGAYDETELKIQEALSERATRLGEGVDMTEGLVAVDGESITDSMPRTPEIYFGAFRNSDYLGNGQSGISGLQNFILPKSLQTSSLYFDGPWTITEEFAEGNTGSSIKLRFQAKKVFIVASSKSGASMKVLVDGNPVGALSGSDVDSSDRAYIQNEKLYRIIEGDEWGEHILELIIENGTLEAFSFTFG